MEFGVLFLTSLGNFSLHTRYKVIVPPELFSIYLRFLEFVGFFFSINFIHSGINLLLLNVDELMNLGLE
jgi:hypothetical protein